MSRKTSKQARAAARARNRNRPGHRRVRRSYEKLSAAERSRRLARHVAEVPHE